MRTPVCIGLGANSGNPEAQLGEALKRLSDIAIGGIKASGVWQSEALGMRDDSGQFTNAVVSFSTGLQALELLEKLQAMEVALGRPRDHDKNVARTIDLDILLYGTQRIDLPSLTVPHPRMFERLFVLLPLREVMPDFSLDGETIDRLIEAAPTISITRSSNRLVSPS